MNDETDTQEKEPQPEQEVVLKAFRQKKRVMIQIAEDEEAKPYFIQTMTGAEKTNWQNSNIDRIKYSDKTGVAVGVKKYDGMESGLIATCLRDEEGKAVPKSEIEKWGSPTIVALGKMCLEFNGLTEKTEDEKGK